MPSIWYHGASLGDVAALSPLVKALNRERPDLQSCVSALTRDGVKRAKQIYGSIARRAPFFCGHAFRTSDTKLLILEYLELWPNAILAACSRKIPIVVVDGHITQKTLRFRALYRGLTKRVDLFCAQSEQDAAHAEALGFQKTVVTGNGKFDLENKTLPLPQELASGLGPFDCVLGSLHPDEEANLFSALPDFLKDHRMLCAPRYLSRVPRLLDLAQKKHLSVALRSDLSKNGESTRVRDASLVILDTIGELAAAYALAPAAIIGGSFGRREGQNMIEAARQGCFLIHGPRTQNIALEVAAFQHRQKVDCIKDALDCVSGAKRCDHSSKIAELQGATERNLIQIRPCLPNH